MKWYELKEQSAGTKRLMLLWYIYNLLGKKMVKFVVFFVTLFSFLGAKENKKCSKKYLKIMGIKPSNINIFKHFLSYSYSLVDRIESFSNNFPIEKLIFEDEKIKAELIEDLKASKGIFFICNHLGNVDILRSFIFSDMHKNCSGVCVFLAKEQCKIFNQFIENIGVKHTTDVIPFAIEDIDINTSIELEERLKNGAITFIAGDRISANSINFEANFLSHKVEFPLGTFKLAQMMKVSTYFVSAIKIKNDKYSIHMKKFQFRETKKETLEAMQQEFVTFLEEKTKLAPYQFYHFYDMFAD